MLARHAAVGVLAVACAGALGACGDEPAAPSPPAVEERADRRGPLPPGWRRVVNRRAGFSLGIPPGWRARGARGATLVRSGDRLLAVSIAADRSTEGRELAPRTYAARAAGGLSGYRRLRVRRPRAQRGARYPGARVDATGRFAKTRVRQAIRVVALRRRGLVTYTLVFIRSSRAPAGLYAPAMRGMIRTFRGQPPR